MTLYSLYDLIINLIKNEFVTPDNFKIIVNFSNLDVDLNYIINKIFDPFNNDTSYNFKEKTLYFLYFVVKQKIYTLDANTIDNIITNSKVSHFNIIQKICELSTLQFNNNNIYNIFLFNKYNYYAHILNSEHLKDCDVSQLFKYACIHSNIYAIQFLLNYKIIPTEEHLIYVLMNSKIGKDYYYVNKILMFDTIDKTNIFKHIIRSFLLFGLLLTDSICEILKINGFTQILKEYGKKNSFKTASGMSTYLQHLNLITSDDKYDKSDITNVKITVLNIKQNKYDIDFIQKNMLNTKFTGTLEYAHEKYNLIPTVEQINKLHDVGRQFVIKKRFGL